MFVLYNKLYLNACCISRTMQSVEKWKLEWNQELELVLTYLKSGIVEVCKSHRCSYQNEELVHSVSELCVYIITYT